MKREVKETLVAGFALFSMSFGAGNLMFPPALGLMSGGQWPLSFLGFFVMDAGLVVLGVCAIIAYDGNIERVGHAPVPAPVLALPCAVSLPFDRRASCHFITQNRSRNLSVRKIAPSLTKTPCMI